MFNRDYFGTHRKRSVKPLHHHIVEPVGRHNIRGGDKLQRISRLEYEMMGKAMT